jgi:hypothetical protein
VEADVDDGRRCHKFDAAVSTTCAIVDMIKQSFAGAQQDGHDHQVELIDQAGPQVLLDGRHATAKPDITLASGIAGPFQRRPDAIINEVECRSAVHREGWPGMVGEDEHRVVVRRVLAPPASPLAVAPRTADRAEHVAPYDGGTDADIAVGDRVIVRARGAAVRAQHLSTGTGLENPLMQPATPDADGVIQALVGPSRVPVE